MQENVPSIIKTQSRTLSADALIMSSLDILRFGTKGVPRLQFLKEATLAISEFTSCDAVELFLQDKAISYKYEEKFHPERVLSFRITRKQARRSDKHELAYEFKHALEVRFKDCHGAFTKKSSFWAVDAPGEFGSIAILPFVVDDSSSGLLFVKSAARKAFTAEDVEAMELLSTVLGFSIASRRAQSGLRESMKELTCLYGMSKLGSRRNLKVDDILAETVKILPTAMQFPENASARIKLDDKLFQSAGFLEGLYSRSVDIVVHSIRRGALDVFYFGERPEFVEGPFTSEEIRLIDTAVKQLALIIEDREAEEDKTRLRDQLRHADRLATIGELSAGVAHELNEPLANILGFGQLALKSGSLEEASKDLEKIVKSALHAREVVKKLMIFSRQTPLRKVPVSLNKSVEEGLSLLELRFHKDNITVIKELGDGLPDITADPSQLNQVLVNLAVNAVQSMPNGGRLTVATFEEGGFVTLSVSDTGIGMTKELVNKIFLPFFTTKEIGEGTGLGLPVVHGIVTAHGGTIKVQSRPGEGTRFDIRLPVAGEAEKTQ